MKSELLNLNIINLHKMKKAILVSLFIFVFQSVISQQETGHYINGIEGIKLGTVPNPGLYYKMYNVLYHSNKLMDGKGNEVNIDFDITVYANVHRFIYITKKKILGADFGMNVIIPLVSTDIAIGASRINDHQFALSDITVEPILLAWHKKRYDLVAALAAVVPVGKYNKDFPASAGKGMWTGMINVGGTYYLDQNKSWAISALSRYEIHSKKRDYAVTPGDIFQFEWAFSKTFLKEKIIWEVGLTGYAGWQISNDKGADVFYNANNHDRQFGIGPEISIIIPKSNIVFSLRAQQEFGVLDRAQGSMNSLSFIKKFK